MRRWQPGGLGIDDIAIRSVKAYIANDLGTHAGSLAYRVLLALFPFLIFLLNVLAVLHLEDLFDWILDQAETGLPQDVVAPVATVVEQVRDGANRGLLSFGLLFSLWAASASLRAAINALNVVYQVTERRSPLRLHVVSVLYTIGLAALVLAIAGLLFAGPDIVGWVADPLGLGDTAVTWWLRLRIPIAAALSMLALEIVYCLLPSAPIPFRIVSPGSVLAVIGVQLATWGFNIYITNIANYNATYGSIGGVIILLVYAFLCAVVLLFGAQINAVIWLAQRERERDQALV